MKNETNKKVYAVEISETRVATIYVYADSEDDAHDRAEELHQTEDGVTALLNNPLACNDCGTEVRGEAVPEDGEKVW